MQTVDSSLPHSRLRTVSVVMLHSANERMTPKSGATGKYAPVLAVPRWRSATTNTH